MSAPVGGAAAIALLVSALACAESAVSGAQSHIPDRARIDLLVGTRVLGVGFTAPRDTSAWGAEGVWAWNDRVLELRGNHQWLLATSEPLAFSAHLGATALVVPVGGFDVGGGPQAGLTLGWSGQIIRFDVGLEGGAEGFFTSSGLRFPVRLVPALRARLGRLELGLVAKAGLDLTVKAPSAFRYEALALVGVALPQ